jgi:hypothetical protein
MLKLSGLYLVVSLLAAPAALPQGRTNTPVRDSEGIAVLNNMLAVTGWGTPPKDLEASATATRSQGPGTETESVSLTLKCTSNHQFRTDIASNGSYLIVNGNKGVNNTARENSYMPPGSAIAALPSFCPPYLPLADLGASFSSVRSLGEHSVEGVSAVQVELERSSAMGDGLDEFRRRASHLVVSISSATSLPVEIDYDQVGDNNPTASIRVSLYLSDFRRVGSMLLPHSIEERIGNAILSHLQISSVQINTGLSDSDFRID